MSKYNPFLKLAIAVLGKALTGQSNDDPSVGQSKPTKPLSNHNSRYSYDEAWELMWPVCQGNEMMPEESRRMMDDIISKFGVDAAVYIALTGWERHEEADAIKVEIGKVRVTGANKIFEDGTYGVYR